MRGFGRWSLRSRLAVTAAVLTAVGLIAANGTGLFLLRSHLVGQVDARLTPMSSAMAQITPDRMEKIRELVSAFGPAAPRALDGAEFQLFLYTTQDGMRALPAGTESGPDLPGRAELEARAGRGPFTVSGEGGGPDWRIQVVRVERADQRVLAVGAASLEEADGTFRRMLMIDSAVAVGVLALLALLARWVVGIGLRPLSRMERTAGEITAGDYSRRVADADPHTEPGRLGLAVNSMLDRVEAEIGARKASEQRMRRFLADASHELRTPLTSVRGFAELARRGGSAQDALARIEAEAGRMGVLVDDLLLLARLDEDRPLERAPVDLLELAAELVRDVHVRHPERKILLEGLVPGAMFEPVVVGGDGLRLRQVIGNLLDNAVRHTPSDASVTVRIGARDGAAIVAVADTGPGIAPRDAPHVFERLYRADAARSPDGGSGLGLAIAAAIVTAHDGRLSLEPTPGGGATFVLELPIPSGL